MKRLIVFSPDPTDATSFYRAYGPFQRFMQQFSDEFQLVTVSSMEWATVGFADCVFMQRPYLDDHVKAASIVKNSSIPLWLDYDDDLFSMPVSNPAGAYREEHIKDNIRKLLTIADHVTVSTQHLADQYRQYNRGITVVPNAIDEWRFHYRLPRDNRQPLVMWRGGSSHEEDLMYATEDILGVSTRKEFSGWVFQFQGYNPFWLTNMMRPKHTIVAPSLDVINYHRFIHDLQPSLMIVPLVPNNFNKSKSNIAWIEGTFAGAAVVAPDWPEWRRPGVFNYPDGKFGEVLAQAMATPRAELAERNEASWRCVMEQHLLSQANLLRRTVLSQLTYSPPTLQSQARYRAEVAEREAKNAEPRP